MSASKYQGMMLPSLLLLLMVMLLGCQSMSVPDTGLGLSRPRQLIVRPDPSRGAIVIGRKVQRREPEPSSTTTGSSTTTTQSDAASDNNATTTTTTMGTTTERDDKGDGRSKDMTGMIEVALAGLRELDNTSVEVGGNAHLFRKFDQLHLGSLRTLLDVRHEDSLPQTSGVSGTCQESRVKLSVAESAQINATIVAKMCAIESNGTAVRDGESMSLMEGQFLLSVRVEEWSWCGCDAQQGHYLEFNIKLTVPEGRAITKDEASSRPVKFQLGMEDSYMIVSTKYGMLSSSETTWKSMPEGYPMLTDSSSSGADVTVRVPRELSGGSYDLVTLVVEPGYKSEDEGPFGPVSSGPRFVGVPALTIATSAFVFMLAALLSQK